MLSVCLTVYEKVPLYLKLFIYLFFIYLFVSFFDVMYVFGLWRTQKPNAGWSVLTVLNTWFWQITPQWLQFLLRICFLKHAFKSQKLAPDHCQENVNVATILNSRISVLNTLLPWIWWSSYSKINVHINFHLKLSFLHFKEIPSSSIPPTQKS